MFVYADNAATTQMSATALNAMLPWLRDSYGNPSSLYQIAREAKRALEKARKEIADVLGAQPEEIYFTSGGTESDNMAIVGALQASRRGDHIVTSAIEHHAVKHTVEHLTKNKTPPTVLPVDSAGRIDINALERALREDTALVSVMAANNEIGTVQPVAEIGALCRERGAWFHTDAVQMAGHLPINVSDMKADMLSLSAHKFHGPKGVGALYIRRGIPLPPLFQGGGHERGRRSGTENVAGVVGMATALMEAAAHMETNRRYTEGLRNKLITGLRRIPYSFLTGDPVCRLPGNASFVFACVEGESMVLGLDFAGICVSSGSACSSASLDPSHVLLAIGLPHEVAHGSLRLSLSHLNTEEEIEYLIAQVTAVVARTRSMSPLWNSEKNCPVEGGWLGESV